VSHLRGGLDERRFGTLYATVPSCGDTCACKDARLWCTFEPHDRKKVVQNQSPKGGLARPLPGGVLVALSAELTVFLHERDLPADLDLGPVVAIDSETMGLRFRRDPLCVVQLSAGDGDAHVVRLGRPDYEAPNLKRLLADQNRLKLFHYGRFDIAMFALHLGVRTTPVYCTKIASRLARTYTDKHGLKDVIRELLGVEISKAQQSSDWGAAVLSQEQLAYAASDVLHLHALKVRLDAMLEREGRMDLAKACFGFLPSRAELDLAGWEDVDIFAHA
jgi:ribonuclease D